MDVSRACRARFLPMARVGPVRHAAPFLPLRGNRSGRGHVPTPRVAIREHPADCSCGQIAIERKIINRHYEQDVRAQNAKVERLHT